MSLLTEFDDYRDYVVARIRQMPRKGHGMRSRLARGVGCQPAFFSQVLKKRAHLSLEQTEALCAELSLKGKEADFFLLLHQKQRAGTKGLRDYFATKLDELKKASELSQMKRSTRLLSKRLSAKEQALYFSEWQYSAIHSALKINLGQTVSEVSGALGLPVKQCQEAVNLLLELGLAVEKRGKVFLGPNSVRLDSRSPLHAKHHRNWRLMALQSMSKERQQEFHYSSLLSFNERDFSKFQKLLEKGLKNVEGAQAKGRTKKLAALNVDLILL